MNLKCIPRRSQHGVELFFPEMSANKYNIVLWDGSHNEASMEYYWSTRPATWNDYSDAVRGYERHYDCKLNIIKRDQQKYRKERWKV